MLDILLELNKKFERPTRMILKQVFEAFVDSLKAELASNLKNLRNKSKICGARVRCLGYLESFEVDTEEG